MDTNLEQIKDQLSYQVPNPPAPKINPFQVYGKKTSEKSLRKYIITLVAPLTAIFLLVFIGFIYLTLTSNNETGVPTEDLTELPDLSLNNNDVKGTLAINLPALYRNSLRVQGDAIFEGEITAPNIINSISVGAGLSSTEGQNPTLTNTGVLSLAGETGAIDLIAGEGIEIDGLTISSTITDTDDQNIFSTISAGGSSFSADSIDDTVTFLAGNGILLSTNTSNKTITITGTATSSPWTESGNSIFLSNSSRNVGIGTSTPTEKLEVSGNILATGSLQIGGDGNSFTSLTGNGLNISSNSLVIDLLTSSDGTGSMSSNSGLEFAGVNSDKLSLLQGCDNGDVLKWDDMNQVWECAPDVGGMSGGVVNVKEGGILLTNAADTLDFSGTEFSLTESPSGEVNIVIDYTNSLITRSNQNEIISGNWEFLSPVQLTDQNSLLFADSDSSHYVAFQSPAALAQNITYTLPADAGVNNYVLTTNGLGLLSWQSVSGVGALSGSGTTNSLVKFTGSSSIGDSSITDDGSTVGMSGSLDVSGTFTSGTANAFHINSSGNITSGVWNGSAIGAQYGGTGINTSASTGVPYISTGTWNVEASLDETRGGTGQTTFDAGDILYASSANTLAKLAGGLSNTGKFLTINGSGVPEWANSSTINFWQKNSGSLSPLAVTDDLILGSSATNSALIKLSGTSGGVSFINSGNLGIGNTTASNGTLDVTGNVYISNGLTVTGGTITLPVGSIAISALASSSVNYGGVTLQLGQSDTTPAFNLADASNLPIETGTTGTLSATRGGTGLSTIAQGSIIYASTQDVLSALSAGAEGTVLSISSGMPTWQSATGAGLTFWQRNSNSISPLNISDDLLIGSNATSSALVRLPGVSNEHGWFASGGNFGIGTMNPVVAKLDVAGSINVSTNNSYLVNGTVVLSASTLGSGVTSSSLTSTGALSSGSIASGFGTIITTNTITGSTLNATTGLNTGVGAGTVRIDSSGNLVNIGTTQLNGVTYTWPASDAAISGYVLTSNSAGTLSWQEVSGMSGVGDISAVGDVSSGNAFTSGGSGSSLYFHDSTFEGEITTGTLSGNQTYTLPDSSGTFCLTSGNCSGTGAGLGGSGTTNYIAKFSDSFVLGNSSIFDDGNVGIGTTTPLHKLSVDGTLNITGAVTLGSTLSTVGNATFPSLTIGTIGLEDTGASNLSSGASLVGVFDEFTNSNSTTIQGVLADLDSAISGGSHDPITLTGSYDYLTLSGQEITLNSIDLTTDITGILPVANGGTGANSLNNLIALTTHTTGNYVATITGSSTISSTGATTGEGTTHVLSVASNSIGDNELEFDTGQALTTSSSPTFNTLSLNSLTVSGDTISDFAGVGLQISGNILSTTLGTSVDLTSEVTGVLPATNGGTGLSTLASGSLLYGSGTGVMSTLGIGNNGYVLTSNGSVPQWSDLSTQFEGTLTFNNGLTRTGDTITLGGALTGTTNIALNTSDFIFSGAGNIGIGTTTPFHKLSVVGDTNITGETTTGGLTVDGTLAGRALAIFDETGGQSIIVARASGNTRFVVDNGGNVHLNIDGSDTSNPRTLSVGGIEYSSGEAARIQLGDQANALQTANGGKLQLYSYHGIEIIGARGETVPPNFENGTGASDYSLLVQGYNVATNLTAIRGVLNQSGRLLDFLNNNDEVLSHFDESGNLRLGFSAPDTGKLMVNGKYPGKALAIFNETGDQAILTASASGTTRFVIQNDGNVGIGITNPSHTLSVVGTVNTTGATTLGSTLSVAGISTFAANINANGGFDVDDIFVISDSGNLTTSGTSTFNGTLSANGVLNLGDGGDAITIHGSSITLPDFTTSGGLLYTDGSGVLSQLASVGTLNKCLQSNGDGTYKWGDCGGDGATSNHWDMTDGAVHLVYPFMDVTLGATSTSSALIRLPGTNNQHAWFNLGTGNFGIGTSDPSNFKLEVAGDIGPTANDSYDLGSTGSRWDSIYLAGSVDFNDGFSNLATIGTAISGLYLNSSADLFGELGATDGSTKFVIRDGSDTNRLLMLDTGNTAIGVNQAATTLGGFNIQGATEGKALAIFNETGDQDIFTASASGQTKFIIDNSGYVGINGIGGNIFQPASVLHLAADSSNSPKITFEEVGSSGFFTLGFAPFTDIAYFSTHLRINGTIRPTGGVYREGGSGETTIHFSESGGAAHMFSGGTAATTLSVQAINSQTGNLQEWRDTTGTPLSVVSVTGNIGIGDSNPTEAELVLGPSGAGNVYFTPESGGGGSALCWDNSGASLIYDCDAEPTADYMEMYPLASNAGKGDIVTIGTKTIKTKDGENIKQLVKSTRPYQGSIIGVVSDKSKAGDFNSIGHNINSADNPQPIALAGRIPVKVTSENGNIQPGDYITSSSKEGVGMKATRASFIVGQALESYSNSDPNQVGTVMIFVKSIWYNPNVQIASDGNLQLVENNGNWLVFDDSGNIIDNNGAYTNATIANLKVGKIKSENIFTTDLVATSALFENINASFLSSDSLTINNTLAAGRITTDEINMSDFKMVVEEDLFSLSSKSSSEETLFTVDLEGNATLTGSLTTNALNTDHLTANEGSIETLTVKNLVVENISGLTASSSAFFDLGAGIEADFADFDFATINADLTVLGTTTLREAAITESIAIGAGELVINSNSINTLSDTLEIQPLKQQPVSIMAGAVTFNTDGTVRFTENVAFEKDVAVMGTLTTNTINVATEETVELSSTLSQASASAGVARIVKGETFRTIENPHITENSLIYVTPISDTMGQSIYVSDQKSNTSSQSASFTVKIKDSVEEDIKFNFLIIN